MQEDYAALKRAIEAISNEVLPDDRLALQERIQEAVAIAGLNQDDQNDVVSAPKSLAVIPDAMTAQGQGIDADKSGNTNSIASSSPQRVLSVNKSETFPRTGRMYDTQADPRLSIDRDPFQRSEYTTGSAVVLPFLGAGAFTLAGRMFWSVVKRFEAAVHDCGLPRHLRPSIYKPMALPYPTLSDLRDQSACFWDIEPDPWLATIDARLARQNAIAGSADTAYSITQSDLILVEKDPASRETSNLKWLSPISAEQRIRAVVGDDVFAVLASPQAECREMDAKGYPGLSSIAAIDGFLDKLAESYVCFGDGPQWDMSTFDDSLRGWCHSLIYDSSGYA